MSTATRFVCPCCGSEDLACFDVTSVTIPILCWIKNSDGQWVPDEFGDWDVGYDSVPQSEADPYGCRTCHAQFNEPRVVGTLRSI